MKEKKVVEHRLNVVIDEDTVQKLKAIRKKLKMLTPGVIGVIVNQKYQELFSEDYKTSLLEQEL